MPGGGKNDARDSLRSYSKSNDYVKCSLQSCSLAENLSILDGFIQNTKGSTTSHLLYHLLGLRAVLLDLTAVVPTVRGKDMVNSYMDFEEALLLYLAYNPNASPDMAKVYAERKRFKELLCHPKYGLCVYVITNSFVVLRPDNIDLDEFFESFIHSLQTTKSENTIESMLPELIQSMETEYDKNVLRVVISSFKTRPEIVKLGIDCDGIPKLTKDVITIVNQRKAIDKQAEKNVTKRINDRVTTTNKAISQKERLRGIRENDWTALQLSELDEEISDLRARVLDLQNMSQNNNDNTYKKRLRGMVRREYIKLVKELRSGLRNKSSGRPQSMDEAAEEFMLQCIENKTTAHGRRGDQVMYTGHRVKKKDYLKLVNYHLLQRNLKAIKCVTTVYNRSRPRNKLSVQAKLHLGMGLFCSKKPPKTANNENDLTHHQRSHKKNIVDFFYDINKESTDYVFEVSMDDKAYLCPATSTGMRGARNQKIIQPADDSQARQLPKYDFPVNLVNVVPATYRVMDKEILFIEEKKETKIVGDAIYVFMRPKYFIGSSGNVWASEFMRLRYEQPHKFETSEVKEVTSKSMKSMCIRLKDTLRYFIDSSEKDDVSRITQKDDCLYNEYENLRLFTLQKCIWHIFTLASSNEYTDEERVYVDQFRPVLEELHGMIIRLQNKLKQGGYAWADVFSLMQRCRELQALVCKCAPTYKSRFIEWTDAGPGVSITNHDVKYRLAQKIRILDADYLIRHHLSNGDSSKNEVERCQGYVGDAICDGEALNWEYKKLLDDCSADQLNEMSLEEFEQIELKRMTYNAFKVCDELVSRVDGAAGPGGYMRAYKSDNQCELFFNDTKFLHEFVEKSEKSRSCLPGAAYYTKLHKFLSSHCHIGGKYLEFIRDGCKGGGMQCPYCTANAWVGPLCTRVPPPMPNLDVLPKYHYLGVAETPFTINGVKREVDDYHPRKNLKELFDGNEISLGDDKSIKAFCNKFIVAEKIVKESIEHLQLLKLHREKKKKNKQSIGNEEKQKSFEQIDWGAYCDKNTLTKLSVVTLNKYLNHYHMDQEKNMKKADKCEFIKNHFTFKEFKDRLSRKDGTRKSTDDSDEDFNGDESDIVLDVVGDEESSDDE